MKLTLQTSPGINFIRAYVPGELRIGETILRTSCLLTADAIVSGWPPETLDAMRLEHLELALEHRPEIILLGSGTRQRFPSQSIMTAILSRGIGLEVMDTAAACRTYNILVGEDRRVVAALLLRDD